MYVVFIDPWALPVYTSIYHSTVPSVQWLSWASDHDPMRIHAQKFAPLLYALCMRVSTSCTSSNVCPMCKKPTAQTILWWWSPTSMPSETCLQGLPNEGRTSDGQLHRKYNFSVRRPLFHAVLKCWLLFQVRKWICGKREVKPRNQSFNRVRGPSHPETEVNILPRVCSSNQLKLSDYSPHCHDPLNLNDKACYLPANNVSEQKSALEEMSSAGVNNSNNKLITCASVISQACFEHPLSFVHGVSQFMCQLWAMGNQEFFTQETEAVLVFPNAKIAS